LIGAMPRPRPPYLQRHVTRHGAVIWYVKPPGGARVRVRGEYGSAPFMEAYRAAMSGEALQSPKTPGNGSLAWLAARYRETARWASLSPATKRQGENILKHVLAASGDVQASQISRKHIMAGIDRRRATPGAARNFLKMMRRLFQWAVEAEHLTADPTEGVKAPAQTGDGFHAWSEDELAAFEAHWPIGTRARLAFDILLYTGLRRGDAVILGRQHVRNGVAMLRTEKTRGARRDPRPAPAGGVY